jgi:hypothetical protein
MNSTDLNHSRTKRASHEHFSPAGRGVANTQSIYDAATQLAPSAAREDLFSQFWTPGLLDRLQSPLTRYRE